MFSFKEEDTHTRNIYPPGKWTNVPWKGAISKVNLIFQASIFQKTCYFSGVQQKKLSDPIAKPAPPLQLIQVEGENHRNQGLELKEEIQATGGFRMDGFDPPKMAGFEHRIR